MNVLQKGTRINGRAEEIIGYLKVGKMTIGEKKFFVKFLLLMHV